MSLVPRIDVVPGGESRLRPEECRQTVIGPGINQPDRFPGYGGFLGWVSPIRLHDGEWILGFNAGYWHVSLPTPMRVGKGVRENWLKIGLPPDIAAPTGGRAMLVRSFDRGKTWSKPETLVDTPADDRHPAFLEMPGGTLVCSFFAVSTDTDAHTLIMRSHDHGRTWDDPRRPPSPFASDETDGPLVLLPDHSILMAIDGGPSGKLQAYGVAILRSSDAGVSWTTVATLKADHAMEECSVAALPDGRWVMIARPEGDISWSGDHGRTWTPPVSFGMRMYAPSLYVLHDGTLLCLHGSYAPGYHGLRAIFSQDGGRTWIAPAKDHGFLVDECYGYGKAAELPDGTFWVADQDTGGHRTADARRIAIRCLRLRVRPDHSGIDLLPMKDLW